MRSNHISPLTYKASRTYKTCEIRNVLHLPTSSDIPPNRNIPTVVLWKCLSSILQPRSSQRPPQLQLRSLHAAVAYSLAGPTPPRMTTRPPPTSPPVRTARVPDSSAVIVPPLLIAISMTTPGTIRLSSLDVRKSPRLKWQNATPIEPLCKLALPFAKPRSKCVCLRERQWKNQSVPRPSSLRRRTSARVHGLLEGMADHEHSTAHRTCSPISYLIPLSMRMIWLSLRY